jgi:hypothetical protein
VTLFKNRRTPPGPGHVSEVIRKEKKQRARRWRLLTYEYARFALSTHIICQRWTMFAMMLKGKYLTGSNPEILTDDLVPSARLELAQLSPLPPQDSVSTNFTTTAITLNLCLVFSALRIC